MFPSILPPTFCVYDLLISTFPPGLIWDQAELTRADLTQADLTQGRVDPHSVGAPLHVGTLIKLVYKFNKTMQ